MKPITKNDIRRVIKTAKEIGKAATKEATKLGKATTNKDTMKKYRDAAKDFNKFF